MKYNRFSFFIPLFCFLFLGAIFLIAPEPTSAFSLFPSEPQADGLNDDFRTYIVAFYNFALPATALVAVVLIMIGGIIWITSAGDQGRISKAKEFIINPIIGLVLLSAVYVTLGFINPNLVILQPVTPEPLGIPGACIVSAEECRFVVSKKTCTDGRFVEGLTCDGAIQQEKFDAAIKTDEALEREQFLCENEDQGHSLTCIIGQIRRIAQCAKHCRETIGNTLEGNCRPSAAFGNDIDCDGGVYNCFCKYERPSN